MITQDLLTYIKNARAQGQSTQTIHDALLKGGWLESDLREAFKVLDVPSQMPQPGFPNSIPGQTMGMNSSPQSMQSSYRPPRIRKIVTPPRYLGPFLMLCTIGTAWLWAFGMKVPVALSIFFGIILGVALFSLIVSAIIAKLFKAVPPVLNRTMVLVGGYTTLSYGAVYLFLHTGIKSNFSGLVLFVGFFILTKYLYGFSWLRTIAYWIVNGVVTVALIFVLGMFTTFSIATLLFSHTKATEQSPAQEQKISEPMVEVQLGSGTVPVADTAPANSSSNEQNTPSSNSENFVVVDSLKIYYPSGFKAYDMDDLMKNPPASDAEAKKRTVPSGSTIMNAAISFPDMNNMIYVSSKAKNDGSCFKIDGITPVASAPSGLTAEIGYAPTGGSINLETGEQTYKKPTGDARCAVVNGQALVVMNQNDSHGTVLPENIVSQFTQIIRSIKN